MIRRLLAAVFAVLVLLVAFDMRGDGDRRFVLGSGGRSRQVADGSAGDDPYQVFDEDEGLVLLCIEDLAPLCRDTFDLFGFTVRTEPAWTTVERLQRGGDLDADVWLTVLPFPELAEAVPATGRTPGLSVPTPVLARSPIAVSGPSAAIDAFAISCPDATVLLACLVGPARTGATIVRDPATSAVGTLALTALAVELGIDPAVPWSGDLRVTEALRTFSAGVRRAQAPLEDALRIGGTAVALTVEAEILGQLEGVDFDRREAELASRGVRYPLDVRAAEIVAVPSAGFPRPRDLRTVLRSSAVGYAFERHGWVAEGRDAYFLDGTVFDARPAVRTDLPWPPDLVREVRQVVAR